MPLRATKNTYAYERAGPGTMVKRKVIANQWVAATWFGDPEGTMPVDGAVEEAEVYGTTAPPASHRFQVPAGDVPPPVEVTGVTPTSLPLSTAPPFDLSVSGAFDPEGDYEVAIVSADGQWTITPSPHGEGGEVAASEDTLVATFTVAPDADNPGEGHVEVKDKAMGTQVGSAAFTWEAGAEAQAAKGDKSDQDITLEPGETAKVTAEEKKPVVKARRRAPDE